jgi:hypothetical protein
MLQALDYGDLVFSCKELLRGDIEVVISTLIDSMDESLAGSLSTSIALLDAADELDYPMETIDLIFEQALATIKPEYLLTYMREVVTTHFNIHSSSYDFSTDKVIHPEWGTLQ